MAKRPTGESTPVTIIRPILREAVIPIVGKSILVTHAWSEKAKAMLRSAGTKTVRTKKGARDPQAEYESSLYRSVEGWPGVPAISFKTAATEGCRYVEGMTMIEARGTIFVIPDGITKDGVGLVRIEGDGPHLREDMVRVSRGGADLRYRGFWYPGWRAMVRVEFNENVISKEQIADLFAVAGMHCGIAEGRPTSPQGCMDWGLFRLASAEELDATLAEAA